MNDPTYGLTCTTCKNRLEITWQIKYYLFCHKYYCKSHERVPLPNPEHVRQNPLCNKDHDHNTNYETQATHQTYAESYA